VAGYRGRATVHAAPSRTVALSCMTGAGRSTALGVRVRAAAGMRGWPLPCSRPPAQPTPPLASAPLVPRPRPLTTFLRIPRAEVSSGLPQHPGAAERHTVRVSVAASPPPCIGAAHGGARSGMPLTLSGEPLASVESLNPFGRGIVAAAGQLAVVLRSAEKRGLVLVRW
jgi:hypothetical protein